MNKLFVLFSMFFCFVSVAAHAMTITNKGEETALVLIKDKDFAETSKVFVEPGQVFHLKIQSGDNLRTHLEVRFPVKNELSEATEFHQDVSDKDKLCVPQRLCQ